MLNSLVVVFAGKDETKVCLPFVKMKKETLRRTFLLQLVVTAVCWGLDKVLCHVFNDF